jgi:DNA-directed RNA polymerase specialized sigma24 family protein
VELRSAGTGSPGPRFERDGLTPGFPGAWADVELPLRRFLSSLGANRHDIDDLVQEVAARALERRVAYLDGEDLRRWAFVVARRAWVDEVRRRSIEARHASAGSPRSSSELDLARVEDRSVLSAVARALPQLPGRDRQVLLAALRGDIEATDGAERNRDAVARHRARKRLRALTGPLAAAFSVLARVIRTPARRQSLALAAPLALASVAVWSAMVPSPGASGDPSRPQTGAAVIPLSPTADELRRVTPTWTSYSRVTRPAPSQSATALPRSEGSVAAVDGPAGAHAALRRDERTGPQPLACYRGDLGKVCVWLPHPPHP